MERKVDHEWYHPRGLVILYLYKKANRPGSSKEFLKVVSSEKVGGSGVTSTLGTLLYEGVVMGILL
jgi:hypothetical protein